MNKMVLKLICGPVYHLVLNNKEAGYITFVVPLNELLPYLYMFQLKAQMALAIISILFCSAFAMAGALDLLIAGVATGARERGTYTEKVRLCYPFL